MRESPGRQPKPSASSGRPSGRDRVLLSGVAGFFGLLLGGVTSIALAWMLETGFGSVMASILFSTAYFALVGWVRGVDAADLVGDGLVTLGAGLTAGTVVQSGLMPKGEALARKPLRVRDVLWLLGWVVGMCTALWLS